VRVGDADLATVARDGDGTIEFEVPARDDSAVIELVAESKP
jgi:hypothetical protein